jgi:hypothetical protein
MILRNHSWLSLSAFCTTFREPQSLVFYFAGPPSLTSPSTPTPTRLDARNRAATPPATRSSSVTTSSLGPRNAKASSLVQAQRPNITSLPTVWLKRAGYTNCFRSSTALSHRVRWSTMTTSAPCTSPPTPSSINAQSTSRSIFTSCVSMSPSVMFEFFMFQ